MSLEAIFDEFDQQYNAAVFKMQGLQQERDSRKERFNLLIQEVLAFSNQLAAYARGREILVGHGTTVESDNRMGYRLQFETSTGSRQFEGDAPYMLILASPDYSTVEISKFYGDLDANSEWAPEVKVKASALSEITPGALTTELEAWVRTVLKLIIKTVE